MLTPFVLESLHFWWGLGISMKCGDLYSYCHYVKLKSDETVSLPFTISASLMKITYTKKHELVMIMADVLFTLIPLFHIFSFAMG